MSIFIAPENVWIVVLAFCIAFILGIGIGANDVANTFGTSVGSKVLTLRQAFILGTIFETAGAVLLGSKVSETIRNGIIDPDVYGSQTDLLMVGHLSAITGCGIWMLVATFFKMPVSTTHSIVGATLGFTLVAKGTRGVTWTQVIFIVISWFASPILAGIVTVLMFLFCKKYILDKSEENPLEPGLKCLPFFYGAVIIVNVFSIFYDGPKMLRFDRIPLWGIFIISFGLGLICAVLTHFFLVPWQRRRILETDKKDGLIKSGTTEEAMAIKDDCEKCDEKEWEVVSGDDDKTEKEKEAKTLSRSEINDHPHTAKVFSYLQILTAIFGAFAHGGNDVSNAVGPLISVWLLATSYDNVPLWILLYGGVSISIGLWLLGRRVIETLGTDLTKVTPSSGFCIELGSAFSVLVASKLGIPISSTHCKVGSIVFVGRVRSRENVDWSLFRNILMAWLLTLPVAGALSGLLMLLLQHIILTRDITVASNLLNSTGVSTFNITPTASYSY